MTFRIKPAGGRPKAKETVPQNPTFILRNDREGFCLCKETRFCYLFSVFCFLQSLKNCTNNLTPTPVAPLGR